jgi:phosphosulfolactate phosphohydrolase-like enzyme
MIITIRNAFSTTSIKQIPEAIIFIDVFRASTTIIALLESEVKTIFIVNDIGYPLKAGHQ